MVDSKLLKDTIKSQGFRLNYISDKLGIAYRTFNYKMNNVSSFTVSEVHMLGELLNLNKDDVTKIFLSENVSN